MSVADVRKLINGAVSLEEFERADTKAGNNADPEAPAEWPDPVNLLTELAAPPFQAGDLPAVLSTYPVAYAEATGFDLSLTMASALSVAAAALSDGFQIVADSASRWFQQPRLWMLVIGSPSAGKSPAQREMLAPMWELHRELHKAWSQAVGAIEEDEDKPPRPCLIVADTTMEALSEVLRDNPRGAYIAVDEFYSWFGSIDLYRKGGANRDRGEWLRVFDGGPHTIERIQRGSVFIENWGASILTATTPRALALLTRQLPEDGLLQRFIPIVARRKIPPQPVSGLEEKREQYRDLIRRLYDARPRAHKGCVPLSIEAKSFLQGWLQRNQIEQEAFGTLESALESHIAKYPTFLLRIALVLHAIGIVSLEDERARDPAAYPVTLETMQAAARFMKRTTMHSLTVFLNMSAGNDAYQLARDVARTVLAKGWMTLERRDLLRYVHVFRKAEPEVQSAAVQLLVELGWLRYAEGTYIKAAPTHYTVNPKLAQKFADVAAREKERRAVIREAITEAAADRRTGE